MSADSVRCMTCGQTYLVASGPPSSGYEAERAVEWMNDHPPCNEFASDGAA